MRMFSKRRSPGRPPHPDVLTPAEWRVLEQVRAGHTNQEIADRLGVSLNTVKAHISSMLAKLDLRDRRELAAWDGEPVEASRSLLARLGLGAPLGWLRDGVGASWLGKAALVAGVAAISLGGYVAVAGVNGTGGGGLVPPLASEPPTATATAAPEPTSTPESPGGAGGGPPDGRLAVGCGLSLCRIWADGSDLVEIAAAMSFPAWPADGRQIAGYVSEGGQLYLAVMAADGSDRRLLLPLNGVHTPIPPAWSPDGATIAVEDTVGGGEGLGGDTAILLVDVPSGEVRTLVDGESYNAGPAWSPDGARIAFTSDRGGNTDLFVIEVAGGTPRNITESEASVLGPAWLPDGRIVFFSNPTGSWDLYVVDDDGGNLVNLTENPANDVSTAHGHTPAAVSPDGRWVAYLSDRDEDLDVYVVEVASRAVTRLSQHGGYGPAWSPDGRYLAFASMEPGAPISIVSVDGTYLEHLHPEVSLPVAWEP